MENKKNAASRSQAEKRGGEKAPQRNKSNRTYRDEKRVYQPKNGSYGAFDRKDRFVKEKAEPIKVVENEINDTESIHGDCETGAVIGRNAVRELLRSDRSIDKLMVQRGERTGSIVVLVAEAIERGIPVIEVEKSKLDSMAGYAPHQGVIALAAEKEYCTTEDILNIAKERGEAPLIVICDGITDPYNLGAIIRCAECCGAHGLIIPKRRAVGLTPLVSKASAGAIEHLAIAKVSNIASTVEQLKKQGIWTYAAEAGGGSLYETDLRGPCAIVLGSEGNGVSQLVRKTCDAVVSIPMYGKVNSFNVSTAAAILLAEVARQHHTEG
ncbi:MAG: 23S rRNA (guanosine(2251)-2'-O)-methyltransferase RlmB [Clostridia bacterium]|nr:23S rRNA (guanosine(2251)-2'-O)-methyltransferase RlmB [Clostridia bacterium]